MNESNQIVGVYSGDRPAVAACKAFTSLRREDKSLDSATLHVVTEGRKRLTTYKVRYGALEDVFLGELMRPIAEKVHT